MHRTLRAIAAMRCRFWGEIMLKSVIVECETPESTVYAPSVSPGFAAWVTPFAYGDGSVGISFDETTVSGEYREEADPTVDLDFAEAAGIPVSYSSVECPSDGVNRSRIYMRSNDGVHFTETGRCSRAQGSFCNIGFPDGRIIGYDVPKFNQEGTGWADFILIRESIDGGNTWREVRRMLKGTAPYLWRVRRLKSGTVVLLASFYGTPWGKKCVRPTRNTRLPGETSLGRILSFFMTSEDGIRFSPPCYILPGLGAHEFDFAELKDGRLLFIAGDVQGTPVGRQYAVPGPDGYILSPVLPVYMGAPTNPASDPQGGFVPETFCYYEKLHLLIGCRRGFGFSVSADEGENWFPMILNGLMTVPYQPVMISLKNDRFALYGHFGGDNALGQCASRIINVCITPDAIPSLPTAARLTIQRLLSKDSSHYINSFAASLTSGGKPLANRRVTFRIEPFWNPDGSMNASRLSESSFSLTSITDGNGVAGCVLPEYDGIPDIHLAYRIDAIFEGDDDILPCCGPEMTVLALTPRRRCPYPYDAYMAENQLFLSPGFLAVFPDAVEAINRSRDPSDIPCDIRDRLIKDGILIRDGSGSLRYLSAVHSAGRTVTASAMTRGDLYR